MESISDKRKVVDGIREEIEASKRTYIWTDYVNSLKLISQVVFTRSSGFIVELIQNAEDAGLDLDSEGAFEIRVNRQRVRIAHNGRPFTPEDVKALCGIRSSKKPERGTLGYLGIGFKSVFKVSDCPEVYSNGFQFRFDRNRWDDPSNTPWHVIPIWIDQPSEIIDDGKTTFVIPYREEGDYSSLREEVKRLQTHLYLFLHWLKKIEVIDELSGEVLTLEDVGETQEGFRILRRDGQEQRFRFFRRTVQVPDSVKQDRLTQEYRANVTQREIVIAFAVDAAGDLAPAEAGAMYGGLYSFLPLGEERSGAKFPIQADFLVQPGREAINYEAKWNHWLVEEVASLCQEAVDCFKKHASWKYQFLPVFEFTRSNGLESHDKLFGPKLIGPVERFIEDDECVPTKDGGWANLKEVVRVTEAPAAVRGLTAMGVLKEGEVGPLMGGRPGLTMVHPDVRDRDAKSIKDVDRWDILKNDKFLKEKGQTPDAATWFRCFYLWLHKHPHYEEYFYYVPRKRPKGYHEIEFVLTADRTLLKGGQVSLLDLPSSDPVIEGLVKELQASKPMLHPDVLAGPTSEEDRKALRGFLTGLTGVQVLDTKTVCKEAILPRILANAPQPPPEELLKYTNYCQQVLGGEVGRHLELWVLTKDGDVRRAPEVLFPREFRPDQDWETHRQYVPGTTFVSEDYLRGVTEDDELRVWRQFLAAGAVKGGPDNGVAEFAMNYAVEKLSGKWKTVTRVDNLNLGYDLVAQASKHRKRYVEVKGLTHEQDVELSANETEAADKYKDTFFVCVVSGIPENPAMHLVQDPAKVGKKDKVTVPVSVWRRERVG